MLRSVFCSVVALCAATTVNANQPIDLGAQGSAIASAPCHQLAPCNDAMAAAGGQYVAYAPSVGAGDMTYSQGGQAATTYTASQGQTVTINGGSVSQGGGSYAIDSGMVVDGGHTNGGMVVDGGSYTVDSGAMMIESAPQYAPQYIEAAPQYIQAAPQYIEAAPQVINVVPAPAVAAPAVAVAAPVVAARPARRRHGGWGSRVYVAPRLIVGFPRDTKAGVTTNDPTYHPAPFRANVTDSYDHSFGGSVAIGFGGHNKGGFGWRSELEVGYAQQDIDERTISGFGTSVSGSVDGDVNVLTGFVNVYGDVPIAQSVALTAGGGLGIARVDFDSPAFDDEDTALAYHLDAGLSFGVTETIALEAMYRYQSILDAEIDSVNGDDNEIDINSHNITAGVRVGF